MGRLEPRGGSPGVLVAGSAHPHARKRQARLHVSLPLRSSVARFNISLCGAQDRIFPKIGPKRVAGVVSCGKSLKTTLHIARN